MVSEAGVSAETVACRCGGTCPGFSSRSDCPSLMVMVRLLLEEKLLAVQQSSLLQPIAGSAMQAVAR